MTQMLTNQHQVMQPGKTKPSKHTKKFKQMFGEEPRIPRKKGQPAGSKKHSDLYD